MRKLAIQNLSGSENEKIKWMTSNMQYNKAYLYHSKKLNGKDKEKALNDFRKRYVEYRNNWRNQPSKFFKQKKLGSDTKPLCVDIEVAAICDLACPFCFRQYIATPDKIMEADLAFKLIDQAAELNVPSMKFNWRGEPLLNPKLPEIIDYAKKTGVLETIINTNATKLDEEYSKKIIKSGLDLLIYSFDGGSKKNYEKMRPGRFKDNSFENVYNNIKNFSQIRKDLGSKFPRTKIQMVLTADTRSEQKEFFSLFKDIVDEVSVKQYTERGGKITDVNDEIKNNLAENFKHYINKYGDEAEIMIDSGGQVFISEGRLPCEQPLQRMLVTYDGRTSMCCYDWGTSHPIGYVDDLAFKTGDKEYKKVKQKSDSKIKGFEMMKLSLPKELNKPNQEIKSLKEIWFGNEINKVRSKHVEDGLTSIEICKKCTFKETYKWKKINH